MTKQIVVSYDRAIELDMVAPIWEIWEVKAREKELSDAAIRGVCSAWMEGQTSLLIDEVVWNKIRTRCLYIIGNITHWRGSKDKEVRAMMKEDKEYKVPAHLRGEIDLKELKKDLDRLNKPTINGHLNTCYGDGYFQKSLEQKYGRSITDLEAIRAKEDEKTE